MAADIWDVPAERVEVSSPAHKYKVAVETDAKNGGRLKSIVVLWDGKRMEAPAAELEKFEKVRIHSLRVITDRPMRTPGIPVLNNRYIAVCLEYGDPVQTRNKDETGKDKTCYSQVFFEFTKFGYFARMKHVPVEGTDRWKLFGKDLGKQEEFDSEMTGYMDSPFGWPVKERPRSDDDL